MQDIAKQKKAPKNIGISVPSKKAGKKNGHKKKHSFERGNIPCIVLPFGFDSDLCRFNCKRIFGVGIRADQQHRTIAHPQDSATA